MVATFQDLVPGTLNLLLQQVQDLAAALDFNGKPASQYSNAGSAIDAFGGSRTILHLDADLEVNTEVVVPPTVLVKSFGGKFIKTGAGKLRFQGLGIGQIGSLLPLFSGFAPGDVTFEGDLYPRELLTEWWDTGNNSFQDRYNRADLSVVNKEAKIIGYPRQITSGTAIVGEKHTLLFTDGDYPNNCANYGVTNFPPFLLKNNTKVYGSRNAKIHESSVNANGWLMYAHHARSGGGESTGFQENINVEGFTIVGDPTMVDTSGGTNSCILVGNCRGGGVRKVRWEYTKSYACLVGLYGTDGNHARNFAVEGCEFIRCGTQVLALINGIGIRFRENYFEQGNIDGTSSGTSTYTVIDIEPNIAQDRVEDLEIDDNTLDCRDIADGSKYVNGIFIQAVIEGSIKNVRATRNKVYGANISKSGGLNPLLVGMTFWGVWGVEIWGNSVRSAFQRAYHISQCRDVKFLHQGTLQCTDVTGDNAALIVEATSNSDFKHLIFRESLNVNRQATGIIEKELDHPVTVSGDQITSIYDVGEFKTFFDLYEGQTVEFNARDYTIEEFLGQSLISATETIGTFAKKTFVDADVNVGADSIAYNSHPYSAGARIWLSTTGTLPAPVDPSNGARVYYVIVVDANNIKVASSYQNAIDGIPIGITSAAGGGTHTITPVMRTKFSTNKYEDCDCPDGITLAEGSRSIVVPSLLDYEPPDGSVGFKKLPYVVANQLLGCKTELPVDPVSWADLDDVAISGPDNKQTRTAGVNGEYTAGAFSRQAVPVGGYLELTATETNTNRFIGLSFANSDSHFNTIDYALYLADSGAVQAYELGTGSGSTPSYITGTVIRFSRVGDEIRLSLDGAAPFHTFTDVPEDDLFIDTSLGTNGATIGGVIIGGVGRVEALSPADARDVLELGTMATADAAANVAELGLAVSNPPTQAQVQGLSDKLDELLGALVTSGAMAAAPPLTNWALPANGASATASSEYTAGGYNMIASKAINGDRTGAPTSPGVPTTLNIWHSAGGTPDHWLEVDFGATRSVQQIDVIGCQDNTATPGEPTLATTFTLYGIEDFDVEYWNGSSWAVVTGGSVTGNDKIWKQFLFTPISTTKIRVLIHGSVDGYGRLAELEAWG